MILATNTRRQVPPRGDGQSDVKVEEASSASDLVEDFFENDVPKLSRFRWSNSKLQGQGD